MPYHHGNLRDALVDAGVALARSGGPDAVVLRAVSRDAGVSHNAAYRHFADRGALLAAVCDRCFAALAERMTVATARVATADPVTMAWERLHAVGQAYVDFAVEETGWFRTAFGAYGAVVKVPDPGPVPSWPAGANPEVGPGRPGDPYAILSAVLDELADAGALLPDRREDAETVAWSTVHGLSSLLVDGPLGALPPGERARATAHVLRAVADGLGRRPVEHALGVQGPPSPH